MTLFFTEMFLIRRKTSRFLVYEYLSIKSAMRRGHEVVVRLKVYFIQL